MKIVLANPPVIRSKNSNPQNDFKIDRGVVEWLGRKVPGLWTLFRGSGITKGIRYGVRAGSRWPWTASVPVGAVHFPFIMAYTASYLQAHRHEISVRDAVADEIYSYDKFLEILKKENADIIILECSTPTIDIDLWFSRKVSQFTRVALAGPHLVTQAERIAVGNPHISYLLKGEYIRSSLQMVETQKPGIYDPIVVDNLDSIPFPYRDFPASVKYYDPSMQTPRPQLQLYASKGCPFKCVYCVWPRTMYMGVYCARNPKHVSEEIKLSIDAYGYKSIFFDDDTFNIGVDRICKLCDELKHIGLPWTMMGRLDTSPPELFDKMVDSGCVGMRFGVETFDPQVLKNIKKGLQTEKIVQTLEHITRKHPGLMIHLTMMKDLPGQTDQIHEKDMKILHDLGYSTSDRLRNYQLSTCAPFPGTELYNTLVQNGDILEKDNFAGYDGSLETVLSKKKR